MLFWCLPRLPTAFLMQVPITEPGHAKLLRRSIFTWSPMRQLWCRERRMRWLATPALRCAERNKERKSALGMQPWAWIEGGAHTGAQTRPAECPAHAPIPGSGGWLAAAADCWAGTAHVHRLRCCLHALAADCLLCLLTTCAVPRQAPAVHCPRAGHPAAQGGGAHQAAR